MKPAEITFPKNGHLLIKGARLLSDPGSNEFARFLAGLFMVPEVRQVAIRSRQSSASIRFDDRLSAGQFVERIRRIALNDAGTEAHVESLPRLGASSVDARGEVRLYREGDLVTGWQIASELPSRIRLRHPRLYRCKALCQDVERELVGIHGIERFKSNPATGSVLIHFDHRHIGKRELIRTLDAVIAQAAEDKAQDRENRELVLCTAAVALSASAQFAYPALLLPAAALFVYTAIPTFISAWRVLTRERRLGVDVLDAIVIVMCLLSVELFAGALLAWCLSFGRRLLARAREDSRRRLVNVFGKQPRHAYLLVDGAEIHVPLDDVRQGDIVVVHTGEMIPVDGVVKHGNAVVDQHGLTGESVPVEKHEGSRVYASTLVVGGKLLIEVETAGRETTSAKISAILNDTAAFRLSSQSKGEEYADRAVIPTLALSALGFGARGLHAATAIVNCDFGTGIRMAGPLALLSSLSVCAHRSILIKDGAALEAMADIDTVLFDKTGTLTQERPIVHAVHRLSRLGRERLLTYAAAAERRVGHPIAQAIIAEFEKLGIPYPETDESSFEVGYGIGVSIGGKKVLVGSHRFLLKEGIALTAKAEAIVEAGHEEGHSLVFVAVDGALVGAIELAPTLREGVVEMIGALRARGIGHIVIISGDHRSPTEKLAQRLNVDRFFAEVLPEDKARYVEILQSEGRRVCFVGDGINDSIALKRANVSISLRGATSVATDTAQVVFMEESLNRLIDLLDISRQLADNLKTSWGIILVPNLLCIGGAFFLGFGVMASVFANNVAVIAALGNSLMPLRHLSKPAQAKIAKAPTRPPLLLTHDDHAPPPAVAIPNSGLIAGVCLGVGAAGLVVPIVPGWLLIMSAISLQASQDPRMARLDRWIHRRFPVARADSLRLMQRFLADFEQRYSSAPPSGARAEARGPRMVS